MDKNNRKQQTEAEKKYRGAATDRADNDKVNVKMVDQDVKELNNNPRNND